MSIYSIKKPLGITGSLHWLYQKQAFRQFLCPFLLRLNLQVADISELLMYLNF
jgi:hypothetical protein